MFLFGIFFRDKHVNVADGWFMKIMWITLDDDDYEDSIWCIGMMIVTIIKFHYLIQSG